MLKQVAADDMGPPWKRRARPTPPGKSAFSVSTTKKENKSAREDRPGEKTRAAAHGTARGGGGTGVRTASSPLLSFPVHPAPQESFVAAHVHAATGRPPRWSPAQRKTHLLAEGQGLDEVQRVAVHAENALALLAKRNGGGGLLAAKHLDGLLSLSLVEKAGRRDGERRGDQGKRKRAAE